MEKPKLHYTTTSDGRTVVDANLLFKSDKVKAFIEKMRVFEAKREDRPASKQAPRRLAPTP